MTCSRKIRPEVGVSSIWVRENSARRIDRSWRWPAARSAAVNGCGESGFRLRSTVRRGTVHRLRSRQPARSDLPSHGRFRRARRAPGCRCRTAPRDHSGGVEPLGGSGRRYPDVDHHQFGPLLARQRNKVLTVATCNPGERISSWQACRFCGWRQAAMGVSGDDICSPQRKSVNHGPRQRRVRLAGLARRRVATRVAVALKEV
jgi:hypothetical protein